MSNEKAKILKLHINKGGLKKILKKVIDLIEENKKFYVCAPNAYVTVKANEDKELLEIINRSKVVIPDGMSTVWYSVYNFYSRYVKRAPQWMQDCGLEWLYRIYAEPRRLFLKYMVYNTKFMILVFRDLINRLLNVRYQK